METVYIMIQLFLQEIQQNCIIYMNHVVMPVFLIKHYNMDILRDTICQIHN